MIPQSLDSPESQTDSALAQLMLATARDLDEMADELAKHPSLLCGDPVGCIKR